MLKNYVSVALRFLAAHPLHAAINILGLAVGLAAALLLALFVKDETSYDRWIPDAERIYRLHTRFDIPGREPLITVAAPGPARAALEKDYPEIEISTRMVQARPTLTRGADTFIEEAMLVDPTFFDVFELPFVTGDRAAAVAEHGNAVISERVARKYFGDRPAVGETLSGTFRWGQRELRVVGVFKNLPDNTHLKLDIAIRLNETDTRDMPWMLDSWTSVNTMTYVKLKPGADIERIRRDLPDFEAHNIPNERVGGEEFKTADYMQLTLMPLPDLHLGARGLGDLKPPGDRIMVMAFAGIAVLILVIAGINFTNLSTARASQRAREVAMRKVLGADRNRLIAQFLSESVLMAMVAAIAAAGLASVALPFFNLMVGKTLAISPVGLDGALPALSVVAVVAGLGAGAYPALILSRFAPARTLKANKSAATEGTGRMRAALVVVQFAISIALIVCTAVVYGHVLYARSMDVGFDKSGLLTITGIRAEAARAVSDSFRERLSRIPGITAVTRGEAAPGDDDENNTIVQIPGQISAQPIVIGETAVDYGYFATMGIPLLAGRELS
jgi:putative ABC transport system permease protein